MDGIVCQGQNEANGQRVRSVCDPHCDAWRNGILEELGTWRRLGLSDSAFRGEFASLRSWKTYV